VPTAAKNTDDAFSDHSADRNKMYAKARIGCSLKTTITREIQS